jgi:glucosamine kinase
LSLVPLTSDSTAAIRYVIGIDGGGTGTRARLTSSRSEVLGDGEAGPSALGQGIEAAWTNILKAIGGAFGAAGLAGPPPDECALGLGLSGANVRARYDALLRIANSFGRIALDTDAYTTLLGAHEGRPGAVVAAGTGSVGEALSRDGTRVSVGGWGFPVGDEGSGAWLGLHAIRRAHHALDGRAPSGPLVQAIRHVAGDTRDALLAWCEGAGQNEYGRLAPLVFDADSTDPWAAGLLDSAARSLEEMAAALDPEGQLPLVVCGSIGRRLEPRFAAPIRARLVQPAGDAVDGALCLIRGELERAAR